MVASPFVSPHLQGGGRVILGEGPLVLGSQLFSTDARRCLLRRTALTSGLTEDIDLAILLRKEGLIEESATPILGCVAPMAGGGLLAAIASGIYLFDLDTRRIRHFTHPEEDRQHLGPHYNDGKVGPDGCFYVGGMIGGMHGAGRLWRVAPDGSFTLPHVDNPPLTTPNGMHWFPTADPDVWDFYYVCSQYPAIQRYEHRLSEGVMSRKPDLVSLPFEEFGYLDGMTGSGNGLLFLCLYLPREYGAIVVDRESGEIVERISTDAPQTTSAAIAGSELYITSAAQGYTEEDFERHPNAGSIYRCLLRDSTVTKVREARGTAPFEFKPL
ncbi:MAG TPA: SMP-30/gluconolactonase/LRE family protein [Fimbriimonas sp.]|nr:SMP-30/gluconolactonase/LRE family protein [Fimbriimonas sp.]